MWNPIRLVRQSLCHHRMITVWSGRRATDVCLHCGVKVYRAYQLATHLAEASNPTTHTEAPPAKLNAGAS